jgi:hypothetical protein
MFNEIHTYDFEVLHDVNVTCRKAAHLTLKPCFIENWDTSLFLMFEQLAIQTRHRSMIHKYLGMYHGVCARFSLHGEAQWDDKFDMSVCELETRRQLY